MWQVVCSRCLRSCLLSEASTYAAMSSLILSTDEQRLISLSETRRPEAAIAGLFPQFSPRGNADLHSSCPPRSSRPLRTHEICCRLNSFTTTIHIIWGKHEDAAQGHGLWRTPAHTNYCDPVLPDQSHNPSLELTVEWCQNGPAWRCSGARRVAG